MNRTRMISLLVLAAGIVAMTGFSDTRRNVEQPKGWERPKGCVYRTLFGEEHSSKPGIQTPEAVVKAIAHGEEWLLEAQQNNGGWGAGSHQRQNVMDPHAVAADPATTSMVCMALLRSGHRPGSGAYGKAIERGLEFLLSSVEKTPDHADNITTEQNTQIQVKLGGNIDVILTAQCLMTMEDHIKNNPALRERAHNALDVCLRKIQRAQQDDGSIKGDGWAGVLQSSLANNVMEMAESAGHDIDEEVLRRSRDFQKSNFDPGTGQVNTDRGAGVLLYSLSGSTRASAKEARKVKEAMEEAVNNGKLEKDAAPSVQNLKAIGYSESEAQQYATAYEIYEAAKVRSQAGDVVEGFGSQGGEEFISYLQTGESMIINGDEAWPKWYEQVSDRMVTIQNNDGSWNGHHCITSPVFCTATAMLILTVNNDIEKLTLVGN